MDNRIVVGIVISIISVVIISIVVITVIVRKRKMQGSGNKPSLGSLTGVRDVDGIKYHSVYSPGGKNSPSCFKIIFSCPVSWNFSIKRETGFDRFFKKIGIASEINTMDKLFDDKFYISTSHTEQTRQFLRKSKVKRDINALFDLKFNTLVLKKGRLVIQCSPVFAQFKKDLTEDRIKSAAKLLHQIAIEAPGVSNYLSEQQDPGWKRKRLLAFAIPILLQIVGMGLLVFGLVKYKPLDTGKILLDSIKYSLPAFIVFIWGAMKLLRGRSTSHREFIIVFFLAFLAFPLAGGGGETFFNGYLDKSESAFHQEKVVKKYYRSSKNGKTYYIVVRSWRENRQTESLRVSSSRYRSIVSGKSEAQINTRAGKYGFEWIQDYRVE